MYVTSPSLSTEARRQLSKSKGKWTTNRTSIELGLSAVYEDGKKKGSFKISNAGTGWLEVKPSGEIQAQRRFLQWRVNPLLIEAGPVSFAEFQEPDDIGPGSVWFQPMKAIDLSTLPWLLRAFVVDQVVR